MIRHHLAPALSSILLFVGCYGSIPPEPPCTESVTSDSVITETRIQRDMSRRPKRVWHVRRDSSDSWIQHGRDVHFFLNGQASSIEWYQNGRLDGLATYWHENGAKQGEIAYVDGTAQGEATTWHDNGRIESRRTWKLGKLDGTEKRWDRRGRLVQEIEWADNHVVRRSEPRP